MVGLDQYRRRHTSLQTRFARRLDAAGDPLLARITRR